MTNEVSEARTPTHYCVVCAARWINHPDGSWSLASNDCGPCCDNVPMDTAPIVKLLDDGSVDGSEVRKIRRAYDAAQRTAEIGRYRGILCVQCDEPFERHSSDWSCPKRVTPRFKFPAMHSATPAVAPEGQVTDEVADAHKDIDNFTLPSERALREACHKADCQWTAINMMRANGTIDPALVRAIYAFARYIDATPAPADEDAEWLRTYGRIAKSAGARARFERIAERLASKGVDEGLLAIADFLTNQDGEPGPDGSETRRLHYWRDKAIEAARRLRALSKSNGEKG